ncbi:MAG TPA: PKD domain-containing protein [Cyclobacteriaceae bacterium]
MPASSCKDQGVSITNTTSSSSFEWDFCDGSILKTPTNSSSTISKASAAFDMKVVIENGNYYVFFVNFSDGKVIKLSYGSSFYNIPTTTDLGNFGVISQPLGIGFWQENSKWYALVSTNPGNLYLLKFGSSIQNTPTASEILGVSGLGNHRQIKIVEESSQVIALIAGGGTNKISMLNFGSSIENSPSETQIDIPNSSFLMGVDFIRYCGNSYVVMSGYNSGLHLLNFGSSLLNTPTITQCSSVSSLMGLTILKSKGNFYVMTASQSQGVMRFDFGTDITNATPTAVVLGKFSSISFAIGFSVVKSESKYFALGINNDNNVLTILDFPKDCSFTSSFQNVTSPAGISYSTPATYTVTLTIKGTNGEENVLSKNIVIQNLSAPTLQVTHDNSCVSSVVTFTGTEQSGLSLSNVTWDFGDGATGTGQGATHSYSSTGSFNVTLQADASNGCSNSVTQGVSIFNPSTPNFDLPSASTICSNQLYTMKNTSVSDVGSTPSFQWKVNGTNVSTATDLSYTFTNTNSQDITLVATIPGCPAQITKTISTLSAGPLVDFSTTGVCVSDTYQFTNLTTGSPDSYSWDFGDGQLSNTTNPQHVFASSGTYQISLTASTSSGCNNSTSKSVTVYSVPATDFSLSLPPFSCTGNPSQFNDLTPNPVDSNLASWAWSFDDPGSGLNSSTVRNAQHTYSTAGDYNVSLTAKTNYGCQATIVKKVTISQSPVAAFSNTPACQNQGVTFSDESPNAQSWFWQIENTTYSVKNPIHVFASSGNYAVNLTVTSTNNCIAFLTKSVTVPKVLVPDFSFQKNCANQNTEFVDLTDGTVDPVTAQQWTFGTLGTASGSPTTFTFPSAGNVSTTMEVTAQSGCKYSITKSVSIEVAPTASFTATPEAGVPPLDVTFSNTSSNAISYLWAFNDSNNTTSTDVSPSFTFNDTGDHVVDLTAYNSLGCSDTFSKIIRAMLPVYDISLIGFNIIKNDDGTLKMIAALRNEGNVSVTNMTLDLSISGITTVREPVTESISPQTSANHILSYEISDPSQLKFLCATIILANDVSTDNNERCVTLDKPYFLYDPYPNPASDELTISWIANSTESLSISMIDAMSNQVMHTSLSSVQGLNSVKMQTDNLAAGIYVLILKYGSYNEIKRISIEH